MLHCIFLSHTTADGTVASSSLSDRLLAFEFCLISYNFAFLNQYTLNMYQMSEFLPNGFNADMILRVLQPLIIWKSGNGSCPCLYVIKMSKKWFPGKKRTGEISSKSQHQQLEWGYAGLTRFFEWSVSFVFSYYKLRFVIFFSLQPTIL